MVSKTGLQERYKVFCLNTSKEDYVYSPSKWEFLNSDGINHEEIEIELKKLSYKDFLLTWYWRTISNYLRKRDKKCKWCKSDESLVVHHNHYSNHGNELHHLDDLIVLCDTCHAKIHKKIKKINLDGVTILPTIKKINLDGVTILPTVEYKPPYCGVNSHKKKKVKQIQPTCTTKQKKLKHKNLKSYTGESFPVFCKRSGYDNKTIDVDTYQELQEIYKAKQNRIECNHQYKLNILNGFKEIEIMSEFLYNKPTN